MPKQVKVAELNERNDLPVLVTLGSLSSALYSSTFD